MKKRCLSVLLVFVLIFALMFTVQAQTQQETLNQYVSDLQNNPNDTALREKIIRLAQTMNPAPAVPEDARRHYVKGRALSEDAKQPSEFLDAAGEFRKALLVAPWWGEAYMLMGIALEAAQRYDDATAALKLSMSASSSEDLKRKTQDEIYKIEAKKEKAAEIKNRESSPEAIAAKKQNSFEDLLKKIDGRRYTYTIPSNNSVDVIDVRGKVMVRGNLAGGYHEWTGEATRAEILGRETTVRVYKHPSFMTSWVVAVTFIISENGDSITVRSRGSEGDVSPHHLPLAEIRRNHDEIQYIICEIVSCRNVFGSYFS